jgi:catechol 2,3-dioxygenase-like lactoylglutathione lyase family enzyme
MSAEALRPLSAKLHHIAIGTPDPAALAGFYSQAMGMALEQSDDGVMAIGPDRRLLFVEGPRKTLGFAGYAVDDPGEVDTIRLRCARLGIEVVPHRDRWFRDGAIMVVDPDGNRIAFGQPSASGQHPDGLSARLQHVVVASANAPRLARFYQDAFGFTLSDDVVDDDGGLRTSFLRCSEEHHSFAVFQAERCWFDHHCYEAGEWNLIRDWGDRFARYNIPVQWGPGRHGPGNNLFLFVHDIDGNWLEISAELERVTADRPVGVWKHEQRTLNSWGSAPLRS